MSTSTGNTEQSRADQAFLREARIGLSAVAILFLIFLYVAFGRLSGWHQVRPILPEKTAATGDPGRSAERESVTAELTPRIGLPVATAPAVTEVRQGPPVDSKPLSVGDSRPRPDLATKFPRAPLDAEALSAVSSPPSKAVDSLSSQPIETHSQVPRPAAAFSAPHRLPPLRPSPGFRTQTISSPMRSRSSVIPTNLTVAEQAVREGPPEKPIGSNLAGQDRSRHAGSPPGVKTYLAKGRSESFWAIAQKHYGDGRYFNALYQHNRDRVSSFDEIRAGTELEIPSIEELHRQWESLCPARSSEKSMAAHGRVVATVEYEVQNGESLFDIARQQLGQASRYLEILELNVSSLPETTNHLTPLPAGLVLRLPTH